jgi:hypothetical protein
MIGSYTDDRTDPLDAVAHEAVAVSDESDGAGHAAHPKRHDEPAKEFEPPAQTIRAWADQDRVDVAGTRRTVT